MPSGFPAANGRFWTPCLSRRALIEEDASRILWGTDWPHPNITKDMPNDGELVNLFAKICPDPAAAAAHPGGQSDADVLVMIIDCHGHYTTAPGELQKFRDAQIAGLKAGVDVPLERSGKNLRRSDSRQPGECAAEAATRARHGSHDFLAARLRHGPPRRQRNHEPALDTRLQRSHSSGLPALSGQLRRGLSVAAIARRARRRTALRNSSVAWRSSGLSAAI